MLQTEIIRAAEAEMGYPFLFHHKPIDFCHGGTITVDSCMEKGLDRSGYDCTGLIIKSLCNVIGRDTDTWPPKLRHGSQLKALASDKAPSLGDILLIESTNEQGRRFTTHAGIYVTEHTVIHANGQTRIVDKEPTMGITTEIRVVEASQLIEYLG